MTKLANQKWFLPKKPTMSSKWNHVQTYLDAATKEGLLRSHTFSVFD
jgi:hypothetical protein